MLGAFLRDFDKVILDIHRVPDKVHKACEALLPILLAVGKATGEISYQLTGSRRVFFPVWYNSFLSEKQYREFHWPYLKYLCEELIKAGTHPSCPYRVHMIICWKHFWSFPQVKRLPGSTGQTRSKPETS